MLIAKKDDRVKVHYTGRLDDGTVFDSSRDRETLEFVVGKHSVIAGFENEVEGMSIGETKTVRIPRENAYGTWKEELIVKVPRDKFPPHITPDLGLHLQLTQPGGSILNVLVTEVTEEMIILDANHPFAGKDLTFDIELLEVIPSQKEA